MNKHDLTRLVDLNLDILEDDASRLIFLSQVYYNMTGDYAYIAKMLCGLWHDYRDSVTSEEFKRAMERNLPEIEKGKPAAHFSVDQGNMFFDPAVVSLQDDEVFCDCGALEMATSLEFAFHTQDHFRKIYAFEPDPVCAQMCHDNLLMFSQAVRDRIFLYDVGLDEANGTRSFARSTIPGNSRVSEKGKERIHVRKLDDLEECQDITFLKIHTEGTELSVIKGAANLIQKNRPTIAVSLYHNLEELVNVPILLHGLVPEYRFFMRHYSLGTSESVLYAVKEHGCS